MIAYIAHKNKWTENIFIIIHYDLQIYAICMNQDK